MSKNAQFYFFRKFSFTIYFIASFLLLTLTLLFLNPVPAHATFNSSIRVCSVIQDISGNIIDGSLTPGENFSIYWLNRSSPTAGPITVVPPPHIYMTPFAYNTTLANLPLGPAGGPNALCTTLTNLQDAEYYYSSGTYPSNGQWAQPLIHDGWTSATNLADYGVYNDTYIMDSDPSNDSTYGNFNGHIGLFSDMHRTVVYINTYLVNNVNNSDCNSASIPTCSKVEVGEINGIGNFTPTVTPLHTNTDYWIKVTVVGRDTAAIPDSVIALNELFNNQYFSVYEPNYDTNATNPNTTFTIKNAALADLTTSICTSSLTCITNKTYNPSSELTGLTLTTDRIGDNVERYIYYKVRTRSNTGTSIPVHNPGSTLDYTDLGVSDSLTDQLVDIENTTGYFSVESGDVFSRGSGSYSIRSELPSATDNFIDNNGILYTARGADLGLGNISPAEENVRSDTLPTDVSYASWNAKFQQAFNYVNASTLNASSPSGIYSDTGTGPLIITGNGWNPTITGNIIIITDNDVYIDHNINVATDGRAGFTILTSGRIGIAPGVSNLDGIYFAEGIIDTACNVNGFQADHSCSHTPSTTSLTVNGTLAHIRDDNATGIALDREKTSDGSPSEYFISNPSLLLSSLNYVGTVPLSWQEVNR